MRPHSSPFDHKLILVSQTFHFVLCSVFLNIGVLCSHDKQPLRDSITPFPNLPPHIHIPAQPQLSVLFFRQQELLFLSFAFAEFRPSTTSSRFAAGCTRASDTSASILFEVSEIA